MLNRKTGTDINKETQFAEMVKRFSVQIYWHIRRIVVVHADAEDIVQETFLKAYQNFDKLRKQDSARAWLLTIATNESMRFLGRNRPEACPIDDATAELLTLHADSYIDYEDSVAVNFQKAMARLPRNQRLAFSLRYYDELNYEEIGKVLDCSANSAKVNYHLAKDRIIKYLNEHDQ